MRGRQLEPEQGVEANRGLLLKKADNMACGMLIGRSTRKKKIVIAPLLPDSPPPPPPPH